MLYIRQRIALSVLARAKSKSLTKIRLQKYLFLLREKTLIPSICSFYDFVPYKFGPYSFLAAHELFQLEQGGLISSSDEYYRLRDSAIVRDEYFLPPEYELFLQSIVDECEQIPQPQLVSAIYDEYPWFAHRSVLAASQYRSVPQHSHRAIFTIGYEDLSIDAFLNTLLKERIERIVDVRSVPISRKFGFSKNYLLEKCDSVSIEYVSLPELGIKTEIRHSDLSRDHILRYYKKSLTSEAFDHSLNQLTKLLASGRSALLCFERDPISCHRRGLAEFMSIRTGQPIIHYNTGASKWEREFDY
jgi:hypothetical protein